MDGDSSESSSITGLLMVVAVVAVVASAIGLFASFDKFSGSGYASSDTGNVTFEIASNIDINFTRDIINWSSGYVNTTGPAPCDGTNQYAILNSNGTNYCAAGWATISQGLIIESLSSVDVNLTLTSNANITSLTSAPGQFQWRVTDNESTSCTGGPAPSTYTEIVAGVPTLVCNDLNWEPSTDSLEIDFLVNISKDAVVQQYRTATITAQAERGSSP
jgi:hypothetical protein